MKKGKKLHKVAKKDWNPVERDIMPIGRDGPQERDIQPIGREAPKGAEVLGMTFQVTDVKKPLMSVARVAEKGNIIQFGPKPTDNFIQTGDGQKIPLEENGRGSYLMTVDFVGGGRGTITVDSGAEDSVCPKEWAKQFGTSEAERNFVFRDASGNRIKHHGARKIKVVSPF